MTVRTSSSTVGPITVDTVAPDEVEGGGSILHWGSIRGVGKVSGVHELMRRAREKKRRRKGRKGTR